MSRDPTARALRLLALLQAGGDWSGPELAAHLGVTARTVRRDAERLRTLGYGVESRPGPGSGYRLTGGSRVPPLLLEPDEVTVLVTGLRLVAARLPGDDAAARALAKLGRLLPASLRRQADAAALATEVLATDVLATDVLDTGVAGIEASAVATIADAVARDGRVRFGYVDQRGRTSTRLVDPYRHVLRGERWYLVAWDVGRGDWRIFRFDRVTDVETVPGTFARHDFPDESIERWLATDFGRATPG